MLPSVRRHEARQRNISTLARRLSRCGFGRSLYCKRGCTSCVVAECSHLVSPGAKITLQANHDCGGMMSPPLHTEGLSMPERAQKKEGDGVGFIGSRSLDFPQNTLHPPPLFSPSPHYPQPPSLLLSPVRLLSSSPQ